MTRQLVDWTIGIHIVGLAVVTILEAWRPGYVSMALPMWLLWVGGVILMSAAVMIKQKTPKR